MLRRGLDWPTLPFSGGENLTKYRLLIRIWVPQDKLYNTAKEAHDAGEKIAKPEDIAVERVDE